MTFPDDWPQSIVDIWWQKAQDMARLRRGSLIFAFVPHIDQIPNTLVPKGRKEATCHDSADITISPLKINAPRPKEPLPVAALSLPEKEIWVAYRAKKRPLLVITAEQKKVDDKYRRGLPRISTSPTLLVAPYYGADQDGSRAGYNPKFAERVRHAIYPQFMLDRLPLDRGPTESLLRLDHIQPVGMHYYSFEHSGYELSEEAV
jgi:hypothetical protein